MRHVVLIVGLFAAGLLAGCAQPPCENFCRLQCEKVTTCSDGAKPTGEKLDACVNSCVDAVRASGATSNEDCNCCSGNDCPAGSRSCETEPVRVWSKSYSC